MVLVQAAAPLPPGEDVLAAERATELCSVCDLSPKSLFVLPQTDHLFGYILRLEHAFYELALNYYQTEIRRVKAKKDHLSRAAHHSLLVRCQFKLAFFNELKQDSQSALRHYKLAFQHLTESNLPDTHWLEWKTVAGFLNYKVTPLKQNPTFSSCLSHAMLRSSFRRYAGSVSNTTLLWTPSPSFVDTWNSTRRK